MKIEDAQEMLGPGHVSAWARRQILVEMTRLYRDLNAAQVVIGRFMAESDAATIERVIGLKIDEVASR